MNALTELTTKFDVKQFVFLQHKKTTVLKVKKISIHEAMCVVARHRYMCG